MALVKVIFLKESIETIIQGSQDEKMRVICEKYIAKIGSNINKFNFLYGGGMLNLELSFKEQADKFDAMRNEMKILVYDIGKTMMNNNMNNKNYKNNNYIVGNSIQNNSQGIMKTNINFQNNIQNTFQYNFQNNSQINNNNNFQNNMRNSVQNNIQNFFPNNIQNNTQINIQIPFQNNIFNNFQNNIPYNTQNNLVRNSLINTQMPLQNNILTNVNNFNQNSFQCGFQNSFNNNFQNNFNNNIQNNFNNNMQNNFQNNFSNNIQNNLQNNIQNSIINSIENRNVIKGVLDIKLDELCDEITLFYTFMGYDIDVYLNNQKINMIVEGGNWIIDYLFNRNGYYYFEIVFNHDIVLMDSFFQDSPKLLSLDFSNFDSSKVISMRLMFSKCYKLKEIKGLNKLITNKVVDMRGLFNECSELEYLDLSNFNTENVLDMLAMFNECKKLKEINGLNKFNTIKLRDMGYMFCNCSEIQLLDLSNFNT